nr:ribonuclease H-like domain, reverse transcriptase, RNA-dependent DNA polymerase [Tanacetum cinerariifolium]
EDPDHPKKVYNVVKALYGLHQAPKAWHQVTPKTSKLLSVKRIFKYLTAYPKLGLWETGNPQLVDVSFLGDGTMDSEPIARFLV